MTKTQRIALTAIFTALVAAVTCLSIPIGASGYVHLGDAVIMVACFFLGWPAIIAGALGAALSDIFLGYMQYALITPVAKALFAVIGLVFMKKIKGIPGQALGFALGGLVMQGVYFLFDYIVFGAVAAGWDILWLLMQTIVSVPLGIILIGFLKKIRLSDKQ